MKLKTILISCFFLLLSKTNAKYNLGKYRLAQKTHELIHKKPKSIHLEILHKQEQDEEFHIEEDLASLNNEPIIFIAELKYALSQRNPNLSEIKELIRSNIQFINYVDPQENTALSVAVEANNSNIVEFLLENGAKIAEKNKSLIIKSLVTIDWSKSTSYQSGIEIISLLLKAGANPNFRENCDNANKLFIWTPLRIVINIITKDTDNNLTNIIRLLIKYGADVNQRYHPAHTTILTDATGLSKYISRKNPYKHGLKKIIKVLKKAGAIK